MFTVSAAPWCKKYMLIIGAAPFINGHPIYKWMPQLSADSWCSTIYKWCKLINGAQHKYFHIFCRFENIKKILIDAHTNVV